MNDSEFLELVMRYQSGQLTPGELARLENQLLTDEAMRRLFAETMIQATAMKDHFQKEAYLETGKTWKPKLTRPLQLAPAMLMLGLLIGLLGGRVVAAMSRARLVVTTEVLPILHDGGFESIKGLLPLGFPQRTGLWSGDSAEIVTGGERAAGQKLRFLKPEADSNNPQGRAIACDLFQLVDLRQMPRRGPELDSSLLELSARFCDGRPRNANPSVTFFCQIYLFRGDPATMHEEWPSRIGESVSSGSAQVTTLGGDNWHSATARCLVTDDADFAVIHIAARPNLRGPMPTELYADNVKLTLKTRPLLPERSIGK